jgi:methylated-DNA-[protein]-cysteine S-methyltransferase
MNDALECDEVIVFTSKLGWMAVRMRGEKVRQLSFGHTTAAKATEAVAAGQTPVQKLTRFHRDLVERLQRYAAGIPVDFSDLEVDSGSDSEFRNRVLTACRKIPYGETRSYGALASAAHSSRAARAVGSCMSGNRVPLIIPCHRVVRAGGEVGPYSAAGGAATKRQLLEMEAAKTRFS